MTFIPATLLLAVLPWVPESRELRRIQPARLRDPLPRICSYRYSSRAGWRSTKPETGDREPDRTSPTRGSADRAARYLYENGKEDECRQVLGRLHGCTKDDGVLVLSEDAEIEFEAMKAGTWDRSRLLVVLPHLCPLPRVTACRANDRRSPLPQSPNSPRSTSVSFFVDDQRQPLTPNPPRSHLVGPSPWAGQVGRAVELQGSAISVFRGVLVAVVVG